LFVVRYKSDLKLILGCVALACALGWAVDLVTAHVAPSYFSEHHPKVIDSDEPLLLALAWGFMATWWLGLITGILLAWLSRRRTEPLPTFTILRWVARACVAIWGVMMLTLVAIYGIASVVPREKRSAHFESDRRLMAVAVAHMGEYAIAGLAVIFIALKMRRSKLPVAIPKPHTG
jgi:hypothetical protein